LLEYPKVFKTTTELETINVNVKNLKNIWAISSQAPKLKNKEKVQRLFLKWKYTLSKVEAENILKKQDKDIVWSM
jgi:hypothetical protein